MSEHFCLKWNNYRPNLTSAFKSLREGEDFVDVTLSADGINLKAHKVVLSACSNYFRDLLKGISTWQHPVLFLRDIPLIDLSLVLEFVYVGEVSVSQDNLQSFLKTAALLRIKGLAEDEDETDYTAMSRAAAAADRNPKTEEGSGSNRKRKQNPQQQGSYEDTTKGAVKAGMKTKTKMLKLEAAASSISSDKELEGSITEQPEELILKQEPLESLEPEPGTSAAALDAQLCEQQQQQQQQQQQSLEDQGDGGDGALQDQLTGSKQDLDGTVVCHVCRAVLSNTNVLYYHMSYVHATPVQNIDIMRSLGGGGDALAVKQENH